MLQVGRMVLQVGVAPRLVLPHVGHHGAPAGKTQILIFIIIYIYIYIYIYYPYEPLGGSKNEDGVGDPGRGAGSQPVKVCWAVAMATVSFTKRWIVHPLIGNVSWV
jgi:hypothetical protein